MQSESYIWPFEGTREAEWPPRENELDTPGLKLLSVPELPCSFR